METLLNKFYIIKQLLHLCHNQVIYNWLLESITMTQYINP